MRLLDELAVARRGRGRAGHVVRQAELVAAAVAVVAEALAHRPPLLGRVDLTSAAAQLGCPRLEVVARRVAPEARARPRECLLAAPALVAVEVNAAHPARRLHGPGVVRCSLVLKIGRSEFGQLFVGTTAATLTVPSFPRGIDRVLPQFFIGLAECFE